MSKEEEKPSSSAASDAGDSTDVEVARKAEAAAPSSGKKEFVSTEDAAARQRADEAAADPNIVNWDGPDDPANPRNWSTKRKMLNIMFIILLTLLAPLGSSMFAPAVPDVQREFNNHSSTIAELVVSIYILGFAWGPLIISPMSEIYGRWPLYLVCNVLFFIFTIACAVSQTIAQLLVFRFLTGSAGVCAVTLGGASIADLIPQEKRGASMALFTMGPLLGPSIGPVAGSYLSANVGWRWNFWVLAIAGGVFTLAHALFCRETFAPVLLARKTARLQKETGNMQLRSAMASKLTKKQTIQRAMVRPLKMFLYSPIVTCMAIYVAIVYGILYLLFTTFTFVFESTYHFSAGNVGLTYLGTGIGMFIGLFINGALSDKLLKMKARKHDGQLKPEYRLLFLMATGILCPIGLFIYGWTAQYHIQWAVPLFGTLLFGVGLIGTLMCIQQYLIDTYTLYAASASAAITVLRSIVAGLLPLAGLSLYQDLGLGWGNSLVAFIALAIVPIPWVFYFFGERIRKRARVIL